MRVWRNSNLAVHRFRGYGFSDDRSKDSNVYLIKAPAYRKAPSILIDPGMEWDGVEEIVAQQIISHILLTHGHIDHRQSFFDVARVTGSKCLIHPADFSLLPKSQRKKIDIQFFKEGFQIISSDIILRVLHTPGHTVGSVSFFDVLNRILFTGDLLVKYNNRVLPGPSHREESNHDDLVASLHRILHLVDEYRWGTDSVTVFPGHGGHFTLKQAQLNLETPAIPISPALYE
ncbi:MAG: MBL fold metallo-hydrolase [Candidatus Saganbacteria bacterium]|nr:MBL fold metallo-hydrolase [Candidatus Saganbacteria bacterium]